MKVQFSVSENEGWSKIVESVVFIQWSYYSE